MKARERVFSIELKSRKDLKNISLSDGRGDGATIEGTIGQRMYARFEEQEVLEVSGTKGVLRVDLGIDEIKGDERDE